MARPISVPFVIIEFRDSQQQQGKVAIEKYYMVGQETSLRFSI